MLKGSSYVLLRLSFPDQTHDVPSIFLYKENRLFGYL